MKGTNVKAISAIKYYKWLKCTGTCIAAAVLFYSSFVREERELNIKHEAIL
jgi:hypothetical protein